MAHSWENIQFQTAPKCVSPDGGPARAYLAVRGEAFTQNLKPDIETHEGMATPQPLQTFG